MIGGLHGDLFHQERLLLNLVDVKIKLIRSKPKFCLQGDAGYKVVLEKINLLVRKVCVSPHAKALKNDTAKYPLNRVLCKVYSVPQGSMSFVQDNIFVGQMLKRIIIGCVDNDAFHGTFEKPPFDFKHYHMNFIGIYVDGQPKPHAPLEFNFDKEKPSFIKEKPSFIKEKPSFIKEKPSFIKEKPSFIKEKPAFIKEKPSFIKEKPSVLSWTL
ncbi:uncharacterized protein F54H12.2 [Caerostris darwini]|uniref:Uncharacterized protein F54H12.2 n=1 Tax=Caerostris darwini TaxID=1538125 RepID=A0AAV4QAK6_9ARAC|nr:uncharacterized protein F54H12.2 [Caerostris darwini]